MHEGYMIDIIKNLNGRPESTEDGQLIYVFREQRTGLLIYLFLNEKLFQILKIMRIMNIPIGIKLFHLQFMKRSGNSASKDRVISFS